MPRFAANLSMMFTELPFLDRFAAAAAAGFEAVEFLFPYEHAPEAVAEKLRAAGLSQVLFNMPPGDWAGGERGMAAIPGREAEFRETVPVALRYAKALGCPLLHCMSGITGDRDRAACEATFIENIRFAADAAAAEGVTLVVEPINTRNMPGYFVNHQMDGIALIDRVGRPNVSLQFDLYHAQIMDGDLSKLIEKLAGRFAHVQVASVPDRHEPDEGELNFPHLFGVLDRVGYKGWIGCEYNPRGETTAGLGWFAPYKAR
ncbi:2-oxo-tetronate isomerase [Muricoccus aerilatus]|uniref:2-oxo-tetronate isomerase n=1 Tax=Muricoccus aerilatus TaxID=452982 RepID=UPI0005C13CAA|nr:2-oxo-tetronate isomerase [Roseomonas aerilata]